MTRFEHPEIAYHPDCTIIYESSVSSGFIPVLCFHKLGDEMRYSLSQERFVFLLKSLDDLGYYPISDKDLVSGDFSSVPSGYSPVILGADDASEMNFVCRTLGDQNESAILRDGRDNFFIDPDCMAALVARYTKPQNGHYPFTFYISFDDIPFRQRGISSYHSLSVQDNPVIREKIRYLDQFFHLGAHSFHHYPTASMNEEEIIYEFDLSLTLIADLTGRRDRLNTIAYPNGLPQEKPVFSDDYFQKMQELGVEAAFDFDGYFARPEQLEDRGRYAISRLGVDNLNFEKIIDYLKEINTWQSRRVIVQSEAELWSVDISRSDMIWLVEEGRYCETENNQG